MKAVCTLVTNKYLWPLESFDFKVFLAVCFEQIYDGFPMFLKLRWLGYMKAKNTIYGCYKVGFKNMVSFPGLLTLSYFRVTQFISSILFKVIWLNFDKARARNKHVLSDRVFYTFKHRWRFATLQPCWYVSCKLKSTETVPLKFICFIPFSLFNRYSQSIK